MTFISSCERALLARQAGTELARRAVGAGLEAGVAPAALAAARHQQRVAFVHEVAELLAGLRVADHRADGDRQRRDRPRRARAVVAGARLAVTSP